jgi:hypothetical protein
LNSAAIAVRFYNYGRRRERRWLLTRAAFSAIRVSWPQLIAAFRTKHNIGFWFRVSGFWFGFTSN